MSASKETWTGIKATCASKEISIEIPQVKKPVIIIRLLDRFGGGLDNDIDVGHNPIFLAPDESGVDLAVNLISKTKNFRLPVVYVSSGHNGRHSVIPDRLSRKLSGLAHVVVEPSREFSFRIKNKVSSRNVYGGAVGVYWPNGEDIELHLYDRALQSIKDFEESIYYQIADTLSKRVPLLGCTWEAVKHLKNKTAIERLKSESADAEEIASLYEIELDEAKSTESRLRSEISRLEASIRALQAKNPVQGGISISTGGEDDYYPNEILGIVIDAIQEYSGRVVTGSRRSHILQSIIESNSFERTEESTARQIKEALRGYKEMSAKVRSTLERSGFEISPDTKHWRLVYNGDERYTYILPKTGSDVRGGLNAGSDICGMIF